MNLWIALTLFTATFILDWIEANYVIAVTHRHPLMAGLCRMGVLFIMAFGVINYVENPLYVAPICIGSFCGTYFTIWRKKEQSK